MNPPERVGLAPLEHLTAIRARCGLLCRSLAGALAILLALLAATAGAAVNMANPSGVDGEIRAQNQAVQTPEPPKPKEMVLPQREVLVPLAQIKEICAHFGLDALWAKIAKDPPARPFKSDGCSLWFNKWQGYDLYPACFRHDLKYWSGYPGEEVERLVADSELMIEVARIMGSTKMAETMFAGVRVGGGSWTRASFAWGFGRIRP